MTKKKLEKLSDVIQRGETILEFGGYTIRTFDAEALWMENEDGEGATVLRGVFKDWLNKLFIETF